MIFGHRFFLRSHASRVWHFLHFYIQDGGRRLEVVISWWREEITTRCQRLRHSFWHSRSHRPTSENSNRYKPEVETVPQTESINHLETGTDIDTVAIPMFWGTSFSLMYTVPQKNKQNYFCYNYAKLPPNLTIVGIKMANCLKLYEVHTIPTPPNLCQCTSVLNADVPNCHRTLQA